MDNDEMMEHYKELLEEQKGVFKHRNKYIINNKECQECGKYLMILEARMCGNGYWSWRCQPCWDEGKSI